MRRTGACTPEIKNRHAPRSRGMPAPRHCDYFLSTTGAAAGAVPGAAAGASAAGAAGAGTAFGASIFWQPISAARAADRTRIFFINKSPRRIDEGTMPGTHYTDAQKFCTACGTDRRLSICPLIFVVSCRRRRRPVSLAKTGGGTLLWWILLCKLAFSSWHPRNDTKECPQP